MSNPAIPFAEFDYEMETTRRLIERVPGDRGSWKPHEKSFPLGHLTQLLALMPGWIADTLRKSEINLAGGPGYSYETTEILLGIFDRSAAAAREALSEVVGDALATPWSLKHGEKTLMTLPRGVAVRQHLNHLIHHRGQLSVYIRMLDVPVPSIYGPTADESW